MPVFMFLYIETEALSVNRIFYFFLNFLNFFSEPEFQIKLNLFYILKNPDNYALFRAEGARGKKFLQF